MEIVGNKYKNCKAKKFSFFLFLFLFLFNWYENLVSFSLFLSLFVRVMGERNFYFVSQGKSRKKKPLINFFFSAAAAAAAVDTD